MFQYKNQLIKEIINKGNLFKYKDIVADLIEKIQKQGFCIVTRYDSYQSVTQWVPQMRCTISLKHTTEPLKEQPEPLHIIWDFLHELGHIQSGNKSSNTPDYCREIKAWHNALVELSNYEILLSEKENFYDYRRQCLKTHIENIIRVKALRTVYRVFIIIRCYMRKFMFTGG